MDRQLRARVLFAEAEKLGISLEDLIAVAKSAQGRVLDGPGPTVSAYLEVIRPTFTPGTRSTCRACAGSRRSRRPAGRCPHGDPGPVDAPIEQLDLARLGQGFVRLGRQ